MVREVINISEFSFLYSLSYFLISIFLVLFFLKIMTLRFSIQFEQLLHGNIAISILFSSCLVGVSTNLLFCLSHRHSPLLFALISAVSTILLSVIYFLIFKKYSDFFEEVYSNNNISVAILIGSLFISIGIILGFSAP